LFIVFNYLILQIFLIILKAKIKNKIWITLINWLNSQIKLKAIFLYKTQIRMPLLNIHTPIRYTLSVNYDLINL
jgi:hypothetical protein